MPASIRGFNAEYLDPVTAGYPLGNGYRWCLPGLMRFNAPDGFSPFGAGGINPYIYCTDDPINRGDPTGHSGEEPLLGELMRDESGRTGEGARAAGRPTRKKPRPATSRAPGAARPAARAAEAAGPSGILNAGAGAAGSLTSDQADFWKSALDYQTWATHQRAANLESNAKRYSMTEADLLLDEIEITDADKRSRLGDEMTRVNAVVRHLKLIGKRFNELKGHDYDVLNRWAGFELAEDDHTDMIAHNIKVKLRRDASDRARRGGPPRVYAETEGPAFGFWMDALWWLGHDPPYINVRKLKRLEIARLTESGQ